MQTNEVIYVSRSGLADVSFARIMAVAHSQSRRVTLPTMPARVIHHVGDDMPVGILGGRG